MEMVHWKAD